MSDTSKSILVTIQCCTYNHENYIRDALDGFISQKTNFTFEAIIHDDASTDGTAEIIKEYANKYPDIIKPIYEKENRFSKKDGSLQKILNENSKGKYIALCEGDDYWIDPFKLQKEVDILENNPQYLMVYTGFECVNEKKEVISRPTYKRMQDESFSGDIFAKLLQNNFILTVTTCFRRSVFFDENLLTKPILLDYGLFLAAALNGLCYFIPIQTSAYRMTPTGAISTWGQFLNETLEINRKHYVMLYLNNQYCTKTESEIKAINTSIASLILRRRLILKKEYWSLFSKFPRLIPYVFMAMIQKIKFKICTSSLPKSIGEQ